MPSNPSRTPDPFSLSPLLSLLPVMGNVARLESLVSSLFVRHETVDELRKVVNVSEVEARLSAESDMLHHILDWLSAQRDEGGDDE